MALVIKTQLATGRARARARAAEAAPSPPVNTELNAKHAYIRHIKSDLI